MIKDSGNRTEFDSGAVRDIQEGKGRCDLVPLDIADECIDAARVRCDKSPLAYIDEFINSGDYKELINATVAFYQHEGPLEEDGFLYDSIYTMLLEYSIHLEEGCKKYGDRNWQKGIPLKNYISSGVRHYLKYLRGDRDERHDRAFIWNMLCGAWTAKHNPQLNEYPVKIGGN